MHRSDTSNWRAKAFFCTSMFVLLILGLGTLAQTQTDPDKAVDKIPTATPIKHVIIIVGENRSFDHLFATYQSKSGNDNVLNLLSEGIVNKDGTPGPNFGKAHQFQIVAPPNGGKFFISAEMAQSNSTLRCPRLIWVALARCRLTSAWSILAWRQRTNSCWAPAARD